jgi:hypothetical protein
VVAVRKDYAAPTELENLMIPISTNMPRLTALGTASTIAMEGGTGYQPLLSGNLPDNRVPGQRSASCRPQRAGRPFHPAKTRPKVVSGGRTGQTAFEFLSREGREGGEVRRTGIH